MSFISPLYGQSNYDLCLQAIGSLDKLVKFCKDNNVKNIDEPKNGNYIYDENDVVNKNVTGFRYATKVITNS